MLICLFNNRKGIEPKSCTVLDKDEGSTSSRRAAGLCIVRLGLCFEICYSKHCSVRLVLQTTLVLFLSFGKLYVDPRWRNWNRISQSRHHVWKNYLFNSFKPTKAFNACLTYFMLAFICLFIRYKYKYSLTHSYIFLSAVSVYPPTSLSSFPFSSSFFAPSFLLYIFILHSFSLPFSSPTLLSSVVYFVLLA